MYRRRLLSILAGWPALAAAVDRPRAASDAPSDAANRALAFPRDFGAHPAARTEWWYVTGWLGAGPRLWGFQVTFFRSATGLAAASTSRFAARQLVFAHAALTDLEAGRLRHDQRIARSGFGVADARVGDTAVALRDWRLTRADRVGDSTSASTGGSTGSRYATRIVSDSGGFAFDLTFDTTQPVLLQGSAGVSQKGPQPDQTSRYYSQPQLAASGTLSLEGRPSAVQGRAWLDHEWSDSFIAPDAVGWDWLGMNLDDGSALTAFRLRRADGTALYAGGSFRRPGSNASSFASGEVGFTPGRTWESPATRARYPVEWKLRTPAGRFNVRALLDDQELDSRASTGAVYWEGLSELLDDTGRRVGRGYLEMTGYAAALKL